MKTTKNANQFVASLLNADTTWLANAAPNKVGLIVADFTPSIDQVLADLTISADTGLVPIAGVAGAQTVSKDPVTGEDVITIKPPAGGFLWETPGGFTGPVTVYGFAFFDGAATTLLGTHKLDTPIVLNGGDQIVQAPALTFRIDCQKIH